MRSTVGIPVPWGGEDVNSSMAIKRTMDKFSMHRSGHGLSRFNGTTR